MATFHKCVLERGICTFLRSTLLTACLTMSLCITLSILGANNGKVIYKICSFTEWGNAKARGAFEGSAVDVRDGYIHFSTAQQVKETAERHFAGQDDLVLIAVNVDSLGTHLKWEASRGGDLFPHLYGVLSISSALSVKPLPLNEKGEHVFS